jgi:hypothetical protein
MCLMVERGGEFEHLSKKFHYSALPAVEYWVTTKFYFTEQKYGENQDEMS